MSTTTNSICVTWWMASRHSPVRIGSLVTMVSTEAIFIAGAFPLDGTERYACKVARSSRASTLHRTRGQSRDQTALRIHKSNEDGDCGQYAAGGEKVPSNDVLSDELA